MINKIHRLFLFFTPLVFFSRAGIGCRSHDHRVCWRESVSLADHYFVFAFAGMEGINKEIPWSLHVGDLVCGGGSVGCGASFATTVRARLLDFWFLASGCWTSFHIPWVLGIPNHPTCHFFSMVRGKWGSACTTPSALRKPF